LSQATTTGEEIAGRIRSRAVIYTVSSIRGRFMSTYIWIWHLVLSGAVVVSLGVDVLSDPAFVPLDHWQVDLDSCNEVRTGIVDCAAADHSTGHLADCNLVEFADMHHSRIGPDQYAAHIARPTVNNPSLCSLVLVAGSRSHNVVLHHSTSHSVALVLDIGLGMLVVGGGDCTGCEP
jgi:hypothetical protein